MPPAFALAAALQLRQDCPNFSRNALYRAESTGGVRAVELFAA